MTSPVPLDTATVPCRRDPESMFPTTVGPRRVADEAAAKAVCRSGDNGRACHAIERCLAEALRWNVDGIWAATTPEERKAIRDKTGRVALPMALSDAISRRFFKKAS